MAADPDSGKKLMEKWFFSNDPDIRWIMRENLKKNRLHKLDPAWYKQWENEMGSKVNRTKIGKKKSS
ncbi:MAG: hypothetical protein ABRQ25_09290 [Clostridiaceae bacterium]